MTAEDSKRLAEIREHAELVRKQLAKEWRNTTSDTLWLLDQLAARDAEIERLNELLAAREANEKAVIVGLEQARGIVKYFSQNPLMSPAVKSVLADVDVFLRANIERGGKDGTADLMGHQ